MPVAISEALLISRALQRGLISPQDLAAASQIADDGGAAREGLRFGARIEALLKKGHLTEEALRRLCEDVSAEPGAPAQTDAATDGNRPPGGLGFVHDATLSSSSVSSASDGLSAPYSAEPAPPSGPLAMAQTVDGSGSDQMVAAVSISQSEFPVPNWDRYEFLGLLGRGGMGAVYKARDRRLGRTVAIKFLHGDNPGQLQRFMQEARAQARLDHPHICKIFEVGSAGAKPYIAMQFIAGLPLDRACSTMALLEKVRVMKLVAEAMHSAHEQGIIHRDLKPSNILVTASPMPDGSVSYEPVVMDFGLARDSGQGDGLTESGDVLGTPAYMSPEQARGEARRLDRRTDVYSLGATLYDILAGRPPFEDETVVRVILQVLNEAPRPLRAHDPGLPEALELIVGKCLNKEATQRYPTAQALAEDLGRFLSSQRVQARRLGYGYRIRYWAQRNRMLSALAIALALSLVGLAGFGVRTYFLNLRKERLAKQQAELSKQLGQEIAQMEWLLRSARQLPLHDLGREKVIVRESMERLQSELAGYGSMSRGLAHYALGRGHMALQEYPQALAQLQQAVRLGLDDPHLHYALGFVFGKHFEQAMYEARLSGGGDWAKKQLKSIEPRYLLPAIASLERGRAMKNNTPRYLEALIAYYQRNFETALRHAEAALKAAPWLYEALKLSGSIHLEQALQLREQGHYEAAEREFAAAVKSYDEAAAIGRSDAEVYEGLAEVWVRQIETALDLGRPTQAAYAAAIAASERCDIAEPHSPAGPLKRAFADLMTMGLTGAGMNSSTRVQSCLANVEEVLKRQPGNPYASDVGAGCYAFASEGAVAAGKDPEPLLRKSLSLLEPAVQKFPHFLWGLNDLANVYRAFGAYLHVHGRPEAREMLQKTLFYRMKAIELDDTYLAGYQTLLYTYAQMISMAKSNDELRDLSRRADEAYARCTALNKKAQQCYNNYFIAYARAAERSLALRSELGPRLLRATQSLSETRKLGGSFLDTEQHATLTHYVEARVRLQDREDPSPALSRLREALGRCFALAADDVMCMTLAARAEWIDADWMERTGRPSTAALQRALLSAEKASRSAEPYPDAWQTLAETHLRLARAAKGATKEAAQHLAAGLGAVDKLAALNKNHGPGLATRGALLLASAQMQSTPLARKEAAQSAAAALEQAMTNDGFVAQECSPLLAEARALLAAH